MDMNNTAMGKHTLTGPAKWLAGIALTISFSAQAADVNLDQIAVVVNQDVILMSDVRQAMRRLQVSEGKKNSSDTNTLAQRAMDNLVLDSLQLQAAKRAGIKLDDASIDEAVASVAQRNRLSVDGFKQVLRREGIDFNGFRDNLSNQLMINELKRQQSSRSNQISEQEISDLIASESEQITKGRSYYIQDLLIPTPANINVASFNTARRNADQLRKLAITSKDFMKTSFANSQATDLGWKSSDQLSFAYLKELTDLEVGQVSDVVHDARGFHVLKIVEQRGGSEVKASQVRVRHILIADTAPDAQAKAESIRQQLQQGGDFATLAKVNSADSGSAQNGGDLGWSDSKRYVAPFAKAVETLPLNTLSPLVKTQFGYHIIEVMERNEVDASRQALETQARQIILSKKQEQDYDAWVQGLRNDAFIEYRLKP